MSTRALQDGMMLLGFRDPTTDAWLAGGSVEFYSAGTLNAKTAWNDKDKASAITSVTLDSSGQAQVYFDGVYKFIVKNAAGTTKYTLDNLKFQARNTSTVTKTANYQATADDDFILCDTDGGAFTVTLAAVAGVVAPITIKNIGSSSNDVTVDGSGAETIDGSATQTLTDAIQQQYVTDGVQWYGSGLGSGTSGLLLGVEVFTSSGTWTKPSGTTSIEVWVVGGGGGGSGIASSATGGGSGGGGGGATYKRFTTGIGTTETVTVGTGGAGGTSGGAGSVGVTSTFMTLTGNNGAGGLSNGNGAAGGTGGAGDIDIKGGNGGQSRTFTATSTYTLVAAGGSSGFGFSSSTASGMLEGVRQVGVPGNGYGGGGSGAVNDGTAVDTAGGAGSGGIVVVKSYS